MPPVPTTSSSSYLSAIVSPTTTQLWREFLADCCFKRGFPSGEGLVHLRVGENEGREDADAVRVEPRLQQQEPVPRSLLRDRSGKVGRRLLRLRVLHELNREHHPEAAHVSDL